MRSPRRLCLALLIVVTTAAHAQPPPVEADAREAAQAAFRVGAQAFRANRFAVAAQSFEEAHARDPRPETAFSIAQANRLQYHFDRVPWRIQRAVQLYEWYLAQLPAGARARDALDHLGRLEPILRELRQRGELVPYAPPLRTQLVVGAEVERAVVTVDGQPVELWQPVDVSAGGHDLVVEAPGYQRAERRVVVSAGTFLPVDVALSPRPGRLDVRAEAGAQLYVDGRRVGTLPGRVHAVTPGEHFVSVTRRGRRPWSRVIEVGRDQALRVEADLEPTGQRVASWWVLGTAGAIAIAAGGAELWAYRARRDAAELDRRRRDLEATPADLARYNARVRDAADRRELAVGLGLGAAGLGVLGLGLWWFDREPPGDVPRFELQPVIGGGGVGAQLDVRF